MMTDAYTELIEDLFSTKQSKNEKEKKIAKIKSSIEHDVKIDIKDRYRNYLIWILNGFFILLVIAISIVICIALRRDLENSQLCFQKKDIIINSNVIIAMITSVFANFALAYLAMIKYVFSPFSNNSQNKSSEK